MLAFFFFFLRFHLFFREKGREGEREGKKHLLFASRMPQLGTWPATQACAVTGNQTGNLLVCRLMLNPLSHTSQGRMLAFNMCEIGSDWMALNRRMTGPDLSFKRPTLAAVL